MDVRTLDEFKIFYENTYSKYISEYYKVLRKEKLKIILSKMFVFSLLIIIPLLVPYFLKLAGDILNIYYKVFNIYSIVLLCITIFAIFSNMKEELYVVNEVVIKDILAFLSRGNRDDIRYEPKTRLSIDSLNELELFNFDVVDYSGKNYTCFPYNGRNMVFSDINTYLYNITRHEEFFYIGEQEYVRTWYSKEKKTIFDGIYIGVPLNKNNSSHIYLIPNNLNDRVVQSKIMDYIKYDGKLVMLENHEFSKKYKVFCDDEIQARYILSLRFMERINDLDKFFDGKKYIVFKEGRRFAICIEGISMERIRKTLLPIFRNRRKEFSRLSKVFDQLYKLINIYHVLDLGNNMYLSDR